MATIRTTCPRCGTVEMGPEAVTLALRRDVREGVYWFQCPECCWTVHKPADGTVVALLLSVGVESTEAGEDDALQGGHALEAHAGGPPLTERDVEAFVALLQDDDRLARAVTFGVG